MAEKGKSPPVGVKPNGSHLLDEHPRLLDHRGFPIYHLITYPSDSLYVHCCGNQYYDLPMGMFYMIISKDNMVQV